MRFGIHTLDEFDVAGKTVLCRVDMNQPVDRQTDTLKSTARIEACVPTLRELSDKGAKLVVLAHQGSDLEYKNFYCTRPHAKVLAQLLDRPVRWIDDVCGPTARQMIRELKDGEILLLDNVRYVSEEQTLFETRLHLTHEQQAKTLLVEKLAPLADLWVQVQSQWKSSGFGPTGMDWQAVRAIADWIGMDLTPADFRRLKALEDDTLKEWLEHASDDKL